MPKTKIIKPEKGLIGINFKELLEFKELLYFLVWRNLKVRYKQTAIGGLWAIIQPLFSMIIFTIFFGKMAKIPSEGVPYAIFSYSGLLLWTYFSGAITAASNSLIGDEKLVSKTYFPRILIPSASTLSGLLDYAFASVILAGLMIYYKTVPSIYIFLIPVIVFFTWMIAAGFGYFLSALNVKYRDIRHAVPFFVQLLIFITPVIYPVSIAPEKYRWILMLNPMTGLIDAHRAVVLGHQAIDWFSFGMSIALAIIIFILGSTYFKSTEKFFADVI